MVIEETLSPNYQRREKKHTRGHHGLQDITWSNAAEVTGNDLDQQSQQKYAFLEFQTNLPTMNVWSLVRKHKLIEPELKHSRLCLFLVTESLKSFTDVR